MAEYINKDDCCKFNKCNPPWRKDCVNCYITDIPAADVEPVRHGKWIRQTGRPEAICSECGREVVYKVVDNRWRFENYCPNCGAKMDKED